MLKQILIVAGAVALMGSAVANDGVHPPATSQTSPAEHQHAKTEHAHGAAVGVPGKVADVRRTVKVNMTDAMLFSPSSINAKRGETVRFVVTNSGKLKHEMVIGSMSDLKKHAEMMRKMPEMEHAEENMVSVAPGKSGELIWKFSASGKVDFACLQPGHFEAGMKGKVAVK